VLHVYHRSETAEKDRKLPSGYTVGQTWEALQRAWLSYCIALYKNEGEKTLYYASIIQKLQRELGIQVRKICRSRHVWFSYRQGRIKADRY